MRDKRMDNRATSPHELLLIRIGHHLWREYKFAQKSLGRAGWGQEAMSLALADVWNAKEAVRVVLRKEWLESYKKRSERGAESLRRHRANAR